MTVVGVTGFLGIEGGVFFLRIRSDSEESETTIPEVSQLVRNQDEIDRALQDLLQRLRTEPALSGHDRDELTAIHVYLGASRVFDELPGWLRQRGYTLSFDSQKPFDDLRQEWVRLQRDFAFLAEDPNSGP